MKMHNLNPQEFIMDEIVSIEFIGEKETVDITVEDTHMFFANGVYTHNSSIGEEIIEADKIAESYDKIMIADFVMSISRNVEDKIANTARCHVIKSRFGEDGKTYPMTFNTANGIMNIHESNSLQGKQEQVKMNNSNEYIRKELASKYKEFKQEEKVSGFEK